MQFRTYGDLFSLTSNMIGAVTLAADEQTQLASFINRRFFEAFQTSQMWPRYVISSEPRTITPQQTIPTSEDGFYIYGAGESAVNGLYQYSQEWNGHASYVLNVNSISFDVTRFDGIEEAIGTYKLDHSLDLGNPYYRGAWVNQTNPFKILAYNDTNNAWDLYDINLGSAQTSSGTSLGYFPYQSTGWSAGLNVTFANFPDEAYFIDRNAANNHWELQKVTGSNTSMRVIYKDGNGNTPSETAWEIVNGVNPKPIVHDLDNIGEFIRIHRGQAFLNNSALEYEFFVDGRGANILNIANTTDGIAYVTYKQEFTPFDVAADYYNSDADVPAEFFYFIAHGAYADFLRVQNRQEEAIAEEQVASKYLALELEKVDVIMNNSTVNKRFSTYVNRQSR